MRMMAFAIDRSRTIISAMILGRRVTAQDVAWLKREVFADRDVSRESADELFAVVRAEMDNAPEWKEFFVDMIAEHVVRQAEPRASSATNAPFGSWLASTNASRSRLWRRWSMCAPRRIARPDWFVTAVKERAARGPARRRVPRDCRISPPTRVPPPWPDVASCGRLPRALSVSGGPKRALKMSAAIDGCLGMTKAASF